MEASSLVSVFGAMIQQFSVAFTGPTAETFRQVVIGWILTPHIGAVTSLIRTLGVTATKHWTVYEKFFYRAAWSLRDVTAVLLLRLVRPWLGATVLLVLDETTCGPRGRHVALTGWFKDASAHAKGPVFHWAHQWLVAEVVLRPTHRPTWRLTLPVAFELIRKKADADAEHPHRTLPQHARAMVERIAELLPDKRLIVAVDGLYATKDFFGSLPENVAVVSRLRKDAALRSPAVPAGSNARRVRGSRLGSLDEIEAGMTNGRPVTLRKQGRTVRREIAGVTCQWYHVCRTRPVRVVFVRDPAGREDPFRAVCNDVTLADTRIVQAFFDRWGIEECFEESKQPLGMERTRGRCVRTVTRQAPMAMVIHTLVKLWYLQTAAECPDRLPPAPPWYRHKRGPSFRDMLAALRRVLWKHRLTCNSPPPHESNDLPNALIYALCEAA